MTRVPELAESEQSEEQRRIAAEIGGARGGVVGGPFAIWLRVPEIADRINALSDRLRKRSKLEKRLLELLVLILAREWNAQYAWEQHEPQALADGLAPAVIGAIREHRLPPFERDDERLIYDLTTELARTKALSDATYARGLATFGLELMIEIVADAGLYTTIAMTLAAFDAPTKSGKKPLS